jgi:ribonucleoside-diphosphate reductase alpha chain
LLHQKAFQRFTDNAVSKTINLPENTSVETISEIYTTAWEYKLKGITIYRYGSKDRQVLQKCSLNTNKYC